MSTQLYRHWDQAGNLLYVGISLSFMSRLSQHRGGSSWFDKIAVVTVEHFASRDDAVEAEKRAIQNEHPLHNKVHSTKVADSVPCNLAAKLAVKTVPDRGLLYEKLREVKARASDAECSLERLTADNAALKSAVIKADREAQAMRAELVSLKGELDHRAWRDRCLRFAAVAAYWEESSRNLQGDLDRLSAKMAEREVEATAAGKEGCAAALCPTAVAAMSETVTVNIVPAEPSTLHDLVERYYGAAALAPVRAEVAVAPAAMPPERSGLLRSGRRFLGKLWPRRPSARQAVSCRP